MTFQPTMPRMISTTTMLPIITAGCTSFISGPPLSRYGRASAHAEKVDCRGFGAAPLDVAVGKADVLAVRVAGEGRPIGIERASPGRIRPEPGVLVEAIGIGHAPQPGPIVRIVGV